MINFTSYHEQSINMYAESPYQLWTLKLADQSTAIREIGKTVFVVGVVSSVASTFFDYNPTISICITAVSGLTWFCFSKIAQRLEPSAESMLKHLRLLTRRRNGEDIPSHYFMETVD
ncbi:MAG: hypothetical protein H0T62_07330 [Parachlamydiaceae bacterium]|nr:hypothetical protein [Parachlamydiaceae bacterium]